MYSAKDILMMEKMGISISVIEKQLEHYKEGFPLVILEKAAHINDGILSLTSAQIEDYIQLYNQRPATISALKFVPASGAASRMFTSFFAYIKPLDAKLDSSSEHDSLVERFFRGFHKTAIYYAIRKAMHEDNISLEDKLMEEDYAFIIDYMLDKEQMDMSAYPKGLLPFHHYGDEVRTAFEEHLAEACLYAQTNGEANVYFTVSPKHKAAFKQKLDLIRFVYEQQFGCKINVQFSVQKPSTDTVAVDLDLQPYRNKDGFLLFRPAGHGALIENLNEITADIVFIKNVDNVVPDKIKETTCYYKKGLAGLLYSVQQRIFQFLRAYDDNLLSEELLANAEDIYQHMMFRAFDKNYSLLNLNQKGYYLYTQLNKPLRVCGVVENKGEHGGGPFWVKNNKGELTLQIIESSQVNLFDPEQKNCWRSATHFNPVDIICSYKNHKGEKFDLHHYIDENTGFISKKSDGEHIIKIQELPGLWNGAMAYWNTILVEVPLSTFNPVKTIFDFLRPEHQ